MTRHERLQEADAIRRARGAYYTQEWYWRLPPAPWIRLSVGDHIRSGADFHGAPRTVQ
jgi:hypothetical protein